MSTSGRVVDLGGDTPSSGRFVHFETPPSIVAHGSTDV